MIYYIIASRWNVIFLIEFPYFYQNIKIQLRRKYTWRLPGAIEPDDVHSHVRAQMSTICVCVSRIYVLLIIGVVIDLLRNIGGQYMVWQGDLTMILSQILHAQIIVHKHNFLRHFEYIFINLDPSISRSNFIVTWHHII